MSRRIKRFEEFSINEGENWIQKAISKEGPLRKDLGKKPGETITNKEIDQELKKLDKKDLDKDKPGVQLDKKDATKRKRLILAKTLRKLK